MRARSGDQFSIRHGALRATVTEVGATLRHFDEGDRSILWGFGEHELASEGRGQVLCPWPNRLEDGHYRFEGFEGQAALDEPAARNAIHGIVRWLPWQLVEASPDSVRLSCIVLPQPAYPFRLAIELHYALSATGLSVSATLHNEDHFRIPVGLGFHPYLFPASRGVDGAGLFIPARTHLIANERGLPIEVEPMASSRFARFAEGNTPMSLQDVVLDDCFCDLDRGPDGRWVVGFSTGDGDIVREVWGDRHFSHVMCFTGDSLGGELRRRAVAIEPMTCAPNALHTKKGLLTLEPDESVTCRWGIDAAPTSP